MCVVDIYEKWRVVDTTKLSEERRAQYESDKAESNRRYDGAFVRGLRHTTQAEINAFWEAFGVVESSGATDQDEEFVCHADFATNPLFVHSTGSQLCDADEAAEEVMVM